MFRRFAPLLCLGLAALGSCAEAEPTLCAAAENLLTWQVQTNPAVLSTDLPPDRCSRHTELRSELLPGGRVAISRELEVLAPGRVVIEAGAVAPCAAVTLRLGTASTPGLSAAFITPAGLYPVELAASAKERCSIQLRPRIAFE